MTTHDGILHNQVAIITGAASGMGRAGAILFAAEGAKVLVADIDDVERARTVETIRAAGGDAFFVHTDVSRASGAKAMADAALGRWGTIDILYNNAAATRLCGSHDRPVHELDEEAWDKMVDITLKGVFLCSKFCLAAMIEKRNGCIINVSSIDAFLAESGFDAYTAAKGGASFVTGAIIPVDGGYTAFKQSSANEFTRDT